jgi:flagellar M-ring protein FliF
MGHFPVDGFLTFVRSLGATRLMAMGAVALALTGFFSFLIVRATSPQMVPLFTDLAFDDSASIVKDLERQGIAYSLKNDGDIIMVPKDNVARLRMKLAEAGLPKGGGVGYEIFDKSDALGTTSFVQNINKLRALEGELGRTIRSIDRVQSARVHLVLPDRPLFSRDKVEPSGSIVLKVRGALEQQQVRAIRHLVATAVNGLRPERVSVIDESGRLLADGAEQGPMGGIGADERKTAFERRLATEVEQIVSSVVGPGRARVQLSAEFDVNRVTQTSDKFDPDSKVVRSSQTREEQSGSDNANNNGVSVSAELPSANANRPADNANGGTRESARKTEEIVNYEISRTTKTEVTEAGRVNRISAAVLIDGTYSKNDKGEVIYQARSKDELDRIAALVRSAIGFDQKRGDQVEIVNLRFAETPAVPSGEAAGWMSYFQFSKDDMMRGAEIGVMALLGLIVLFTVVRPLVRRIITPEGAELARNAAAVGGAAVAGAIGVAAPATAINADGTPIAIESPPPGGITTSGSPNVAIVGNDEQVNISNRTSNMIDIAKVQGQVHAQSVQKVGEIAQNNPHEAVAIIRSWLHEDAA